MNQQQLMTEAPGEDGLYARRIEMLQVNVGLRCNQSCRHCHLECSPDRTKVMDWGTMLAESGRQGEAGKDS